MGHQLEKIAVIGPGIVGMPMAAMLAKAEIRTGQGNPARVIVVQRNSATSGWKVNAINRGISVIGGIEPELDRIVSESVKKGLLSATHEYNDINDADLILVCVQTDKKGFGPDYGPMFSALTDLARALQNKPAGKKPLIVFESTLAPSSMLTLISKHFSGFGLEDGKDIWLGNSPNRVMPGRLVERIRDSDKLIGGISEGTPERIKKIYDHIVTRGKLYTTNSMTAEVVKTLENAYRDVRIAFSTELVRYCDMKDIDFYILRDEVNKNLAQNDDATAHPNAVPSGGILIPTIGVGGHCLPKDGILLWWRKIESGADTSGSMILNARLINDESPACTIEMFEKVFGEKKARPVGLLGTAYRFNSEDTRNSPGLQLALQLLAKEYEVILHDPFVKTGDQNLIKNGLDRRFTNKLEDVLGNSEYLIMCTAHKTYLDEFQTIIDSGVAGILDGCNIFRPEDLPKGNIRYTGIGRGTKTPEKRFIDFVYESFRTMEKGLGLEVEETCSFLNRHYARDSYNQVDFREVQRLAASCSTGCEIADPEPVTHVPDYYGFRFRLLEKACIRK